ncbi:MAG: hypothetical protein GY942_13205, partial [Aestuariibacter sp.]|nr:hypothetical protein [Aestuariibacter sp.]
MNRIVILESQVQALAAAWLHLTAQLEMNHGLDRHKLTGMLRTLGIEGMPEYRKTLHQLCDELDQAAQARAAK